MSDLQSYMMFKDHLPAAGKPISNYIGGIGQANEGPIYPMLQGNSKSRERGSKQPGNIHFNIQNLNIKQHFIHRKGSTGSSGLYDLQ